MTGFHLKFAAMTGQYQKTLDSLQKPIAKAATAAISDAGDYVKKYGRANIAAAGFSIRWQNALRVNLYPAKGRGDSLHPAAQAFHKIPYAGIFETGGTIAGSPLLWLPLPEVPSNLMGRHMTPANYVRLIGPLHTIFRPGKPPLLAGYMAATSSKSKISVAKLVAGNRAVKRALPGAPTPRVVSVPLFYGIDKVSLQKRFDLYKVFNDAQKQLGAFYLTHIRKL